MEKRDRIKELVEKLNEASKKYYQEDTEIMSNLEYDALYDELVELEKETGIVMSNSPTVHVGYKTGSKLPREAHGSQCCLWIRPRVWKHWQHGLAHIRV